MLSKDISDETFAEFSEKLREFESNKKINTVEIELYSPGGDSYSALAFAGRMRTSPLKINVTAHGLVASAAVLILAYGTKRRMTKESWVMVHEDSGKLRGNVETLEREAKHMRTLENQWMQLLSARTHTTPGVWAALHKEEKYLTSSECLAYGLVDEVI
jgi:ATP-dependent Clp protease, protease subunit